MLLRTLSLHHRYVAACLFLRLSSRIFAGLCPGHLHLPFSGKCPGQQLRLGGSHGTLQVQACVFLTSRACLRPPFLYSPSPSPNLTVPSGPLTVVYLCDRLMTNYVTFVVGEILLLILTICSLAAIFPRVRSTFPSGPEAL